MIPHLVPKLKPWTKSVLVNALYFKGVWTYKFDPKKTTAQPFTLAKGNQRPVPMMHQARRDFAYRETGTAQAVSLPYGDGRFEMVVVLPKQRGDARAWLLANAGANWRSLVGPGAFMPHRGALALPRMKLSFHAELKDTLRKMGMPAGVQVFGEVSKVIHQSEMEVNELGTKAAAATAVITGRSPGASAFTMTVDRPFLLALRERRTGLLLFLGYVADPGKL